MITIASLRNAMKDLPDSAIVDIDLGEDDNTQISLNGVSVNAVGLVLEATIEDSYDDDEEDDDESFFDDEDDYDDEEEYYDDEGPCAT